MDAETSSGAADPLIGQIIHDRFRIIARIARGGMGAVYKAEQAPLGRLVAIKVLSPRHDEDKDPEFRKRFFLEAATVAKLHHPNTVTVFDYGQSDGLYFIVMELIDGVTLKHALKRDGPFEPSRALHVTKQICRSLREAHRLGIVHRDMKPGNVMLLEQGDEKDYVKVLDFGLVKEIEAGDDDLTQTGVFMGSPKYMSPEQIQGSGVDGRCDIYSVGVLLYEMLTGAPPFVREKPVRILMDHLHTPVPPLPPSVPPEIAAITMRCLAKKREERFAHMDELLTALKYAAGEFGTSGELALSGERHLERTPVSGMHALAGVAISASSSGPMLASAVASPSITPSTVTVPSSLARREPPPRTGRVLTAVLAVLALALVAGIVAVAVRPSAGDTAATAAGPEPRTGAVESHIASPAAQAPAVEPTPAQPQMRTVLVELDSQPPGAMVRIGDTEYGPTPAQVELTGEQARPGTELTFVFSTEGHRATTVVRTVPADGRLEVTARMRRIRRAWTGGVPAGSAPPAHSVTPAGYRESPY